MGASNPKDSPPKLTPRQREEIRLRYLDGESATALGIEFGVSARGLYVWLPRRK